MLRIAPPIFITRARRLKEFFYSLPFWHLDCWFLFFMIICPALDAGMNKFDQL